MAQKSIEPIADLAPLKNLSSSQKAILDHHFFDEKDYWENEEYILEEREEKE